MPDFDQSLCVRSVIIDYTGADGMPKPFVLHLAAGDGALRESYERRAGEAFTRMFPEWRIRCCRAEEEDALVRSDSLVAIEREAGIWVQSSG